MSQAALTLDCLLPTPCHMVAWEVPLTDFIPSFPQVPDLKPLSSEWVASLHMGTSC